MVVGPRTPFAQDPIFDYSYDSGDEWQDEEGGEDVDEDVEEGADEDGDDVDEDEGEFDDWLDDSEDVVYEPSTASLEEDIDAMPIDPQPRLPMKIVKKRDLPKKVVKLMPFWRGPMWEDKIGTPTSDMEIYGLQLLNGELDRRLLALTPSETPDSLDPFDYVSADPAPAFKTTFSTCVIGVTKTVKTMLAAEPVASEKASVPVPDEATNALEKPETSTVTESNKRVPKVAFPATHLPELLHAIEGSTKIRSDLVSELRGKFEGVATKVAIDAKLKEVATRGGKTKDSAWRVLPEAWVGAKS